MTLRQSLNRQADAVHARLDRVLDSEDAIVVLMDRRGITSYCHGFGASGCQLELLWHRVEAALRGLIADAGPDRETARTHGQTRPALRV